MEDPAKIKTEAKTNMRGCKQMAKHTVFWRSVVFNLDSCVQLLHCGFGMRSTDLEMFIVWSCQRRVNTEKTCWCDADCWTLLVFGLLMMVSSGLNNQEQSQTAFMYPQITTRVFGDAARDTASWCLFMAHRHTKRPYHLEPPNGWNAPSETSCRRRLGG